MMTEDLVHSTQVKPTRLLIVDDSWITGYTLQSYFASFPDIKVVGVAQSGEEAVRMCDELAPDLVLMDYLMPGMNGIAATRLIHERHPAALVVILSIGQLEDLTVPARDAGASAVISKLHPGGALIDRMRDILKLHLAPA